MKAAWGSGGIAPLILDLGTRWRWVVSFTPRLLYPQGKIPSYPLDRKLGGPQSRAGSGGEKKNSQHLPGLEPPITQPVVQRYTTELSRPLLLLIILHLYLWCLRKEFISVGRLHQNVQISVIYWRIYTSGSKKTSHPWNKRRVTVSGNNRFSARQCSHLNLERRK
jgi:hypothetical protein